MSLWNEAKFILTCTRKHTHIHILHEFASILFLRQFFLAFSRCIITFSSKFLFPPKVTHQGICISIHQQICSTKAQSKFQDHRRIRVMKSCRGSEMKGADEAACKGDIRGCFYSVCSLMRSKRQRETRREHCQAYFSSSNTQNRPYRAFTHPFELQKAQFFILLKR